MDDARTIEYRPELHGQTTAYDPIKIPDQGHAAAVAG